MDDDEKLILPENLEEDLERIMREHDTLDDKNYILSLSLKLFDIVHPIEELPKEIKQWLENKLIEGKRWEYKKMFDKLEKEDHKE